MCVNMNDGQTLFLSFCTSDILITPQVFPLFLLLGIHLLYMYVCLWCLDNPSFYPRHTYQPQEVELQTVDDTRPATIGEYVPPPQPAAPEPEKPQVEDTREVGLSTMGRLILLVKVCLATVTVALAIANYVKWKSFGMDYHQVVDSWTARTYGWVWVCQQHSHSDLLMFFRLPPFSPLTFHLALALV
jgi:hypothetical protein